MPLHRIEVYLDTCDVMVHQHSGTRWIASGVFRGKPLIEKGSSERAALDAWKSKAEWRYRSG